MFWLMGCVPLSLFLCVSLQWVCQFCTYLNYSPATMCEMCDLARPEPAPLPVKLSPPSPVRRVPALPIKPKEPAPEDCWRQRLMKEEGLKLIHLIRASHSVHLPFSMDIYHIQYLYSIVCVFMFVQGRGKKRIESRGSVRKR